MSQGGWQICYSYERKKSTGISLFCGMRGPGRPQHTSQSPASAARESQSLQGRHCADKGLCGPNTKGWLHSGAGSLLRMPSTRAFSQLVAVSKTAQLPI